MSSQSTHRFTISLQQSREWRRKYQTSTLSTILTENEYFIFQTDRLKYPNQDIRRKFKYPKIKEKNETLINLERRLEKIKFEFLKDLESNFD